MRCAAAGLNRPVHHRRWRGRDATPPDAALVVTKGSVRPRAKRTRREPREPEFHHSVYVILLKKSALREHGVARLNPKRDPAKPIVYVGMTGLPIEHRFENHKHGYKSARVVERHWVKLLPELYEHLNPMPFEAAAQMEKDLAEDLRAEGYTVTGGT
jgi:hypothetical protein